MALEWVVLGYAAGAEAIMLLFLTLPGLDGLRRGLVSVVRSALKPMLSVVPFCLFLLMDIYWKYETRSTCDQEHACTPTEYLRHQKSITPPRSSTPSTSLVKFALSYADLAIAISPPSPIPTVRSTLLDPPLALGFSSFRSTPITSSASSGDKIGRIADELPSPSASAAVSHSAKVSDRISSSPVSWSGSDPICHLLYDRISSTHLSDSVVPISNPPDTSPHSSNPIALVPDPSDASIPAPPLFLTSPDPSDVPTQQTS